MEVIMKTSKSELIKQLNVICSEMNESMIEEFLRYARFMRAEEQKQTLLHLSLSTSTKPCL
jgi:hypothetical protein